MVSKLYLHPFRYHQPNLVGYLTFHKKIMSRFLDLDTQQTQSRKQVIPLLKRFILVATFLIKMKRKKVHKSRNKKLIKNKVKKFN